MREDLIQRWESIKERLEPLRGFLDTSELTRRIEELDAKLSDSELWNDPARAAELNRTRARLAVERERGDRVRRAVEDCETLLELAREGEAVDDADLEAAIGEADRALAELEVAKMLSGEDDHRNAILSIHPGAGGVDAQDWAEMLLRMYLRWAERRNYKTELVDRLEGEGAGIKSATCRIIGPDAYGWLKSERGVHRLVRISPFDAQARRHTAFAAVDVIPEVDDDIEITIDEKDLRIDTFRSSGAGGQHVNVTDSAVRITHLPTGIVVTCQDERSQHRNREKALKMLRARLYEKEVREREEKRQQEAGEKVEHSFGNQLRSYVLAPYRMVKDHRTRYETGDVDAVLDGDLTPFMKEWLIQQAKGRDG
ncbi:MAG: peptide chain release factor 2 [Acidobacteria bacterium]|nr:MAG: peptide chain release factor 2 [Acidobacteriota bacterium]